MKELAWIGAWVLLSMLGGLVVGRFGERLGGDILAVVLGSIALVLLIPSLLHDLKECRRKQLPK